MKSQKSGDYESAARDYEVLFQIDVMTNDYHWGSPTIRTLRYLAYRNRGLLHFDVLRSKIDEISSSEALEQFVDSLDDLVESLQYMEGDEIIINLLLNIFKFFDNDRLSRFLIEYELTKEENDDFYLHESSKLLSPNFVSFLEEEKKLLQKIGDLNETDHDEVRHNQFNQFANAKSFETVGFLQPLKEYVELQSSSIPESRSKKISLDNISWKAVASKLLGLVVKSKVKSHRYKDGYLLQDSSLFSVSFTLVSDQNEADVKELSTEDKESTPSKELLQKSPNQESAASDEVIEIDPKDYISLENTSSLLSKDTNSSTEIEIQKTSQLPEIPLKHTLPEGQPQRSSKRFRQQNDVELENNRVNEYDKFLDNLASYLRRVDLPFFNIDELLKFNAETTQKDLVVEDFQVCLNDWSSRHSEFLSFNASKDQSGLALTELINTNIINADGNSDIAIKDFGDDLARNFIHTVNSSRYHFSEVRAMFLSILMSKWENSHPLIDFYFDRELFSLVERMFLMTEVDLFKSLGTSGNEESATITVAAVEILINHWIQLKQKAKIKGTSHKVIYELQSRVSQTEEMIHRWKKLASETLVRIEDGRLQMRLKWCSLLFLQHEQVVSVKHLKHLLSSFFKEFQERHPGLTIQFPNYEAIPTLSAKMIKNQSDKLNVLTTFENTLNDDKNETSEANALLEIVLLGDNKDAFTDEQRSMEDFVSGSSVSLKLKLWKILLDSYISSSDSSKYQKGLSVVLPMLLDQISGESYASQSELQRQQSLLNTIGFYGDYIEGFACIIEKNGWSLVVDNPGLLRHIVRFWRILFCYLCHEQNRGLTTQKSFHEIATKSSLRIRDIITNTFIVLFCFYVSLVVEESAPGDESKYDFFTIIHEHIGSNGFCDAADGRFLRLSQFIWANADSEIFESDILQHLTCRFHINISNGRYNPLDHHTKSAIFDKTSAISFVPCLMNMILRKRDPLFNVLKPDLKSGLDVFFRAIGEPDVSSSIIQRNDATISQYLDLEIDNDLFKNAFMGSINIGLRTTLLEEQSVADQGLFYCEAVTNLNMYRVRKKAMQAKASDLEDILKMIKADLLYGTEKAESWLLLGQTFSLQVEDDLIWTSDKLNIFEKKLLTASTQRKSILSFLMALNILIRNEIHGIETNKPVFALVLSHLSKELYHSLTKPMSGLCFEAQSKKILTYDGITVITAPLLHSQKVWIFKIILHTLKMSLTFDENDWLSYYYLAQVMHKLNKKCKDTIDTTLKACTLNKSAIEPQYLLCSLLYKYVKSGRLEIPAAIETLDKASSFFGVLEASNEGKTFEAMILSALRKISQVDKKKWHHKHRYLLSRIYFDLKDFEKAYEEIEPLIVLKSTNKNLVNIWKPEFEPPGKHFVYTHKYILYYIMLVDCLADFQKLLLFTKKLRRYGAGMINLNEAWEAACATLCHLTKEIVRSEPGFTDIEVPKLIYVEFVQASQCLTNKYQSEPLKGDETELLTLLYEISEIRRMNNGFGSTSQLDDTFNTIYLKLYLKNVTEESKKIFVNQQTLSLIKPNGTNIKTKVARRDILASATALVKGVEPKLKDYKITDEQGFNVPDDIKESHINSVKGFKENSPDKESQVHLEQSVSNLESTKSPINNNDVTRTPDHRRPERESTKSINDSDDEFHTPTTTAFEGEDP